METPSWALWLAYWLHMLATVVWIGGLAALAIFVLPAARRALDAPAYVALLSGLQQRFDPLGWFSLAILAGTGMFQMSASPNYQGFLAVENLWATAILIKHLLFFIMAGLSAYLTWGLMPKIRRLALRRAASVPAEESEARRLAAQETRLLQLNLLLGVLVLALTAIARAA
jgi:uncharacterized membrane protein